MPSVGFQMRHMVRSLDRLLTYAEGRSLSAARERRLAAEMEPAASREALFTEFEGWIQFAEDRV